MNPVPLLDEAHKLPFWRSAIIGQVGQVNVKIERMNAEGQPAEKHTDFNEALIVLEGNLELECGGVRHSIKPHQMFLVPIDTAHQVMPGSTGVVLIVNLVPGAFAEWIKPASLP